MKKLTFISILILTGLLAKAQEDYYPDQNRDEFRTIFQRNDGRTTVSGFGGPLMTFGSIDGQFAHMMGGGGGVILNDFFFGGFGLGMTTNIPYINDELYNVDFGYGGLWFGYNGSR